MVHLATAISRLTLLLALPAIHAQSQPPTHGDLHQLVTGAYYTVRSFFSGGCLDLCNSNLTDCSPPYMNAAQMGQVWLNPICTGATSQLWRTVPSRAFNGQLTFFLVNKMQNFCLNRCFGGGCGYDNNMVGYQTCFLNNFNQAFYFNGSQVQFAQTGSLPAYTCLTACFPGSNEAQCDYTESNLITPYNTQALPCANLVTQQWFTQ